MRDDQVWVGGLVHYHWIYVMSQSICSVLSMGITCFLLPGNSSEETHKGWQILACIHHTKERWEVDRDLPWCVIQSPILLADPGLRTIILSWWPSYPRYECLELLLSSPYHFLWQWWGSRNRPHLRICFYSILVLEVLWDLTNQK